LDLSLIGLFDFDLVLSDGVFDYSSTGILRAAFRRQRIYWIPDLQDIYMPELFSQDFIEKKKRRYEFIAEFARHLIFSSYDSRDRFKALFPKVNRSNIIISVLQFCVFHPDIDLKSTSTVLTKYGLSGQQYFIVANQFMAHKNHRLVIEAVRLLKDSDKLNFTIVFTGKTQDPRNINFFNEIRQLIEQYGLVNDIMITGIISREDQLILMKSALAVIQPSQFEGWNSSVEDAKLLNVNLICSDIPVHREQLTDYPAKFIDPHSPDHLAILLEEVVTSGWIDESSAINYRIYQEKFSREVEALFLTASR